MATFKVYLREDCFVSDVTVAKAYLGDAIYPKARREASKLLKISVDQIVIEEVVTSDGELLTSAAASNMTITEVHHD